MQFIIISENLLYHESINYFFKTEIYYVDWNKLLLADSFAKCLKILFLYIFLNILILLSRGQKYLKLKIITVLNTTPFNLKEWILLSISDYNFVKLNHEHLWLLGW